MKPGSADMTKGRASFLDEIIRCKIELLASIEAEEDFSERFEELQAEARKAPPVRDFKSSITTGDVNIIAEVKRASPSKGIIRKDYDPAGLAAIYEENGASAVSVLTEERFFQGSLSHLSEVRGAVGLPLLRKDFIVAPYQVFEARAAGADAILLIVAALDDAKLTELFNISTSLDMAVLVEVHTAGELRRALKAGAEIIGINNRDLKTFTTDLSTTIELVKDISAPTVVVSESGINTASDISKLRGAGVHSFLIGEAFLREDDPASKLRELRGLG